MKKEKYIAPFTSCRTIESCHVLLEGSVGGTVPDIGITDEVKEQKFDFSESPFTDNSWDN